MPRAWHLKSRPDGLPTPDNFELKPIEPPPLEDGMVRVANRWLSVDPYMRGRMNAGKSYAAAWEVGDTMQGGLGRDLVDYGGKLNVYYTSDERLAPSSEGSFTLNTPGSGHSAQGSSRSGSPVRHPVASSGAQPSTR